MRSRLWAPVAALLLIAAAPPAKFSDPTAIALDQSLGEAKAAMGGAPATVVPIARRAIAGAAAIRDEQQRHRIVATANWLASEASTRTNDAAAAEGYIDAAFTAAAGLKDADQLRADMLLTRGELATMQARVAPALTAYHDAFTAYRALGNARKQAVALQSIGSLYSLGGDYETALRYYAQAQDIYSGDPVLLVAMLNNRGTALDGLKRAAQAAVQFEKALIYARKLNSQLYEAMIYANLGRNYLDLNSLPRAERNITAGLAAASTREAAGARPQLVALAAELAYRRGDLARAKTLIGQAFAGLDLTTTDLSMHDAHDYAHQIYSRTGDTGLALAHLVALKRLDDKTAKLTASANTALMAARFDFTNQNLKIAMLQKRDLQRRIAYERAQAQLQARVFAGSAIAGLIVLIVLAIALFTVRRSRNEVRAANVDLEHTNTALAKALAAKTEFLATTSHEIRTPLNGILGMTQVMLSDRALDERLRDRIGVVHGAGVTMKALVDDILDVAKMETGNLTVDTAPLDLPALLKDLCRLWDEQARAKGLSFTLNAGEAPAWVDGDAARLRQVLFNLLSNAVKFTDEGGVTLSAHAAADRLRISVRDTGIGVEPDKHEVIFESFRQADSGTTRRFGGTGLGLAICRNLARAMGGDVLLDSVMGEGSTFTLDLPLVLAAAPTAPPADGAGALLIVDRNPITRSMLKALFAGKVPTVLFAGTLEEGVETIERGGVGRVILDEATARAVGEELPTVLQGYITVPTFLLWSTPDDLVRQSAHDTDVEIVEKPIQGAGLVTRIMESDKTLPAVVSQAA